MEANMFIHKKRRSDQIELPTQLSLQVPQFEAIAYRLVNEGNPKKPHRWLKMCIDFYKANLLTNVMDLSELQEKIYNHLNSKKSGNEKLVSKDTSTLLQYVGYVATFLGYVNDKELKHFGLTLSQKEVVKQRIFDFKNEKIDLLEKHRTQDTLSAKEEKNLENAPSLADMIALIREIYHNEVRELYDSASPNRHRFKIEKYIILMLYILEPNVRSALHQLKFNGNCLYDNIIMFAIDGKVTICLNQMKRDTQTPILMQLCEESATMMRKHYEVFLKGTDSSYMFKNFHWKPWTPEAWNNNIRTTLKDLFPDSNLGPRLLRILEITTSWDADMTVEEKTQFAQARGQLYVPGQSELYNRNRSRFRLGKLKRSADLM
ncbi:hypothetical protein HK097_001643 [Rhizophlyctis rosea]|uniref:Uncharacterized protein n=1 Tax=Rhizophlyctis rosea TaxID=64517 RepID=A0AAD5X1R5_9FUNG|nr:hypothetical protein HK097_001643 [Rhizophlyctis rosea]